MKGHTNEYIITPVQKATGVIFVIVTEMLEKAPVFDFFEKICYNNYRK